MTKNLKFKVRALHKSFGNHHVLNGIDLDVRKDKSLVILGGSGSGKSVLIKSMIGLLTPDSGSVLYDNRESVNISHRERLSILENCGYLFQGGALFDSLSVKENVTFFAQKLRSMSKKDIRELASEKLHSVGLTDRVLDLYPSDLSGGMQKRVALARTICTNPKVIFFDEPTTGLDPIMSNVINDLIVKIREELGATTITITHDMNSTRKIAQDVAFLYEGQIMWTGSVDEMDKAKDASFQQFINGNIKGPIAVL
jgi:phospholipid/cholesterol/gamma-HCH transport system ATP-binding protein